MVYVLFEREAEDLKNIIETKKLRFSSYIYKLVFEDWKFHMILRNCADKVRNKVMTIIADK